MMNNFGKRITSELVWESFIRVCAGGILLFGIFKTNLNFLLAAGLLLGFHYGWNNDPIWEPIDKKLKKKSHFPKYRGHQIWVHVMSGIIGSIALYNLLKIVHFLNLNKSDLTLENLILLIIATLGYTGLLPRSLWFYANKGGN